MKGGTGSSEKAHTLRGDLSDKINFLLGKGSKNKKEVSWGDIGLWAREEQLLVFY